MTRPIQTLLVVGSAHKLIDIDKLNALSEDQYEIVNVADIDGAIQRAKSPYLSACIVDESIGPISAFELFARLDALQSHVPVVYVAADCDTLCGFQASLPDLVIRSPVDHSEMLFRLNELLSRDRFSEPILDAVVGCIQEVVIGTFMPDGKMGAVRMRAGHIPVHIVNADIPFCGADTHGRVALSADIQTLQTLRHQLLNDAETPSARMLEDLAGEMSNQILGGLKRALGRGGLDFASGVPLMYTANRCPVRYRGTCGSMLVHLYSQADPTLEVVVGITLNSVCVDFGLDENLSLHEPGVDSGELSFL